VQARNILLETSDNYSSPNNDIGYGLLSAKKALSFPNIYQVNNIIQVNKIFFSQNGVIPETASINYAVDNLDFTAAALSYDDTLKYNYRFPSLQNGQNVYFYYTHNDSLGNNVREPVNNYYYFTVSNLIDSIGLSDGSSFSVNPLSQNFPNPFSKTTKIEFNTNSNVSLTIYNVIGQRVKTFYSPQSPITWNGKSDNGTTCASGVYIYVLNAEGKVYANKMMFVK
jgi:hypothetical protein